MRRLLMIVLTVLALVTAACSDSGDKDSSGSSAPSGDAPASAEPASTGEDAGPNGPWVQDLWVYERVSTLDKSGEPVDLIEDILGGLGTPSRSVELPQGGVFHVHDSLDGTVTTNGMTRTDVEVIAGVLEFDGASTLSALATPAADAARPIGVDDSVELDVTFLGDLLSPGDPLVVDFAFLQARVAADEGKAAGGLELLAARLAAGEGYYYGHETDEGDEPLAFQAVLGEAVPGSTRMGVPGKGPISGPWLRGVGKGLACWGPAIRCVRKYFKESGKGAKGSNDLLRCNLGPCGDPPATSVPDDLCIGLGCPPPRVRADPHVTSFDGQELSMQGVGEYVVTQSPGLEIQMRTAPVNAQSRKASAVNMVALQAGEDRVVVDVEPNVGLTVRINDTVLDYDPVAGLRAESQHGALTVARLGQDVLITGADGWAVRITRSFSRWLDLAVTAPTSQPELVGLLGDADGDTTNDWTTQDGVVLPSDTTGRDLYTGFSDTWRVTQEESILRYGAGETTETFTDLSFPDEVTTLADLDPAVRSRAAAVCRMAGVDAAPLLGQCTLDYALSGQLGFVASAQDVLRLPSPPGSAPSGSGSSSSVDAWTATPSSTGLPTVTTFRHDCPAGGTVHSVWGGDGGTYTDDSSICTAAVHAGLLTLAAGGSIEVTRTPGLPDYGTGSTQHGVTARSWEKSWSGSFTLKP